MDSLVPNKEQNKSKQHTVAEKGKKLSNIKNQNLLDDGEEEKKNQSDERKKPF